MKTTQIEIKEIRERLKKIRFEKGLTQDNMADMLSISQNSYHKLENGHTKMSLKKFMDICIILQVEVTEVINGPETVYKFSKYYKKPEIRIL